MSDQKNNKANILFLLILFFSAFAVRVCAFHNIPMMNPDGPVYIHQARAIYYGLWGSIGHCSEVDYLTLYTVFIAAVYPVTGNWMHAAMAVNLIFGTLMIIPLYLFLRRFTDEKTGFVTAFIFAMMPILVIQSVNVIRDPSYWFFSMLGLYLLVNDDEKRKNFFLILSSLSFLIATATRIEGIIFVICGCLYTMSVFKESKWKTTMIFLSPVILSLCCFIAIQLLRHPDKLYWYRFKEVPLMLTHTFDRYRHVELNLTNILRNTPPGIMSCFIENSRTFIWFTAIGVILQSAWEAMFYFFFVVLLLGLTRMSERIRSDRRILPLIITTIISLIVLYFYCINTWSMENRRLVMVILPSSIFIGFGIEKIISWMHKKFNLSESVIIVILCVLILLITLPKNLRKQEEDKLVFKEIGQTIAVLDGGTGEIEMMVMGDNFRWINYYANLHVAGAPCPDKNNDWRKDKGVTDSSYKDFIGNIRKKKIKYFIWEENRWPVNTFPFLESARTEDLKNLKEWKHRDTGRIILFQVLYPGKG
jgi:4-amino-4-deoxy-L-arabinose transferase-like glycosyltransferase